MALPINIEELIHGNTIEWERLEFKQGWNPEDVMHSMCAFANDLHNWGGGYIVLGVAEQNGKPVLPPAGLQQDEMDAIQKKIVELGNKLLPNYFPIAQPYLLQGKHILVLWCPAGDNRVYTALSTLGDGATRQPYVRVGSNSIMARGETLRQLQELTARIPFDDRINNQATLNDLDLGLIREYLQEVKSDLLEESARMSFAALCRTMLIAKGPNEDIRPVNVGLLFFSKKPEQFFNRTWIELVWHKDDTGKNFIETYFKGPLHKQLRDALSFLQSNVISEQVIKHADKAEADRFYNYPFEAIEESLSNAVYHKSYAHGAPIEIQVFPDKITILSYPGPVPPVNKEVLSTQKRIIAREYRNRRIGDFLKELRLTEGRGTGLPAIYDALEDNGSPKPIFETDDANYVLVTIPIHNEADNGANNEAIYVSFKDIEEIIAFSNGVNNGAINEAINGAKAIIDREIHSRVIDVLTVAADWIKRADLFKALDLSNQSTNRKKYLDPLLSIGWIKMEYPEIQTHPEQRYRITQAGTKMLQTLTQL